jgi:hypothetical protein
MKTSELLDLLTFRRLDSRNCNEESMSRLMVQAADVIVKLDADAASEKAEKESLRLEVQRLQAILDGAYL